MIGKCFSCGSADHFANSCSLAKDIKCKGILLLPVQVEGTTPLPPKLMQQKDSLLQLEYRPAVNENKYAKARALSGGGGYYYPPLPVPLSGSNHYGGNNNQKVVP